MSLGHACVVFPDKISYTGKEGGLNRMLLFFYLFFVIVIHNFVAGEGELSPAFAVKCLL